MKETPWGPVNGHKLAALASLAAGAALMAYAVATGAARVGFFLFVPFVSGSGLLPLLAMGLVFAAFVLYALGSARDLADHEAERAFEARPREDEPQAAPERRARSGGVVLLGPIPIVWGSDRRILPWMVAAGGLLLALGLWLTFRAAT